MRVLIIMALLLPALAQGANQTCTVPRNDEVRFEALCEILRAQIPVRPAAWSLDLCSTELLRIGRDSYGTDQINNTAEATKRATVQADRLSFETSWPVTSARARCGDGVVDDTDPDLGEQCDDGAETLTCDDQCTTAACGNRVLNVTTGEQCDDGNTTPGDGCDAACQIE